MREVVDMAEPKIAVFDIFCGYGGTSVGFREVIWNQGFPGTFEFVGSLNDQAKQVGNAVPVPLAKAVGEEFFRLARKKREVA